mgnify:CR=1 FL=1
MSSREFLVDIINAGDDDGTAHPWAEPEPPEPELTGMENIPTYD